MKAKHSFLIASCVVAAVVCFGMFNVQNTHAATITWSGGGPDANWTNASNWTGGVVPGSSDVAVFNDTCTSNCDVAINASTSILGISVSSSFRGSITQDTGSSITIGSNGFYMDGPNNGTSGGVPSSPSGTYYGKGKWGPFAEFFNGGNNSVATSKLLAGAQKYSLSLWFQSTTSTSSGLLIGFGDSQMGTSSNYDRQVYLTSSGQLTFDNYNGSYQTVSSPSSTYNDGNWHNVVGALDNSGQYLYVDGVLVASSTNNAAKNYSGYWHVGHGNLSGVPNAPTNYFYSGLVEDARIYNRALSVSEIADLYINSSTVNGLQDYWAFDEGSGYTAYDTAGNYTFNGSSNVSDTITINGALTVNGGLFKSAAGNLTVTNNVTLAAGSFNANGGTVTLSGNTATVSCSGSPFNLVVINKAQNNRLTINAGCSIPLGANATSTFSVGGTVALTNYGTITAGNWVLNGSDNFGSWLNNYGTITVSGSMTFIGGFNDIQNYGTLTVSGSSWTGGGLINENSNASFSFGGTALTIYGDFEIAIGTAPSGLTVTVTRDASDFRNGWADTTLGCTSTQLSRVNIVDKHKNNRITVLAGCTVPLGANASSTMNQGGAIAIYNYGTITAGNWTLGNEGNIADAINNYGTVTLSGWMDLTSGMGDVFNHGTFTVEGTSWTGGGFVNETGDVFNYNGTTAIVSKDFEISSGTAPVGLTVTVTGYSYWGYSTNIGCSDHDDISQLIIQKGNQKNQTLTVLAGCTVPLGANPTSTMNAGGGYNTPAIFNYGTITASGTWTASNSGNINSAFIGNYGTVTVSGSMNITNGFGDVFNYGTFTVGGTSWIGGGFINEIPTATFSYGGTAMQIDGDLEIATGTAPVGLTVTVTAYSAWDLSTILGCNATNYFGQVIINKVNQKNQSLTVLPGCTMPLGANASSTMNQGNGAIAIYNYGTITAGNWTFGNDGNIAKMMANYGTVTISGSLNINNIGAPGDIYNYGTFTVDGNWTGGGLINETATSTFNFGGTAIAPDFDFEITGNTASFPNGIDMSFNSSHNATVMFPNVSVGGFTINKGNGTLTLSSPAPVLTDTGDLVYYGGTLSTPNPYTFNVQGNYLENASGKTFATASTTVNFTGDSTSTVNVYAGTYAANFAVSKNGSYAAQLQSDLAVASGTCAVNSGTFDVNSHNFTCGGAFNVDSGGWLADYDGLESSTTITFGSTVTNNGMVFLDGSVPASCASSSPANNILIRSTVGGTHQAWSGAGKFVMRYVNVQDQAGTTPIMVWNGTDNGNNGANWTFDSNMSVPELVQSASGHVSGAASTSLAFGYWPKPSDFIVVAVSARGQGILAPTDSAGNTYTEVTSTAFTSSTQSYGLNVYYAHNVASTSTFSITIGGTSGAAGTLLSGAAFEYTGVDPSATMDTFSANTDSSENAINFTSGNAGAFANEIAFAASTFDTPSGAAAAGSGWTPEAGVSANDASDQALYTEDRLPTSSVRTAATWTATASTSYNAILAVFSALPGVPTHHYAASGTLDSVVFDTRDALGAQLNSVLWHGTQPAGTSVGFQIAVSNSSSGPWNFMGPSGDTATYFTGSPGSEIPLEGTTAGYSLFTSYQYFRYRVILFSNPTGTATPTVNNIIVNWSP